MATDLQALGLLLEFAMHRRFPTLLAPSAPWHAVVLGTGSVGRALAQQLRALAPRWPVTLTAVANSRQIWWAHDDPELNTRRGAQCWRPHDLETLIRELRQPSVIFDATASEAVSDRYAPWIQAGHAVITANKRAGSGPMSRYRTIRAAEGETGTAWRYEATVGAGLPVIRTLRDLLDTGDAFHRVQGVLSGSLAWLFQPSPLPFADRVIQARDLGYTEPDPRDDLSGRDVARKLVILAREAGHALELADVAVESLVPAHLADVPLAEFLDRLGELNAPMAARHQAAAAEGKVWRHVATLDAQGARVGLIALDAHDPLAQGQGTDNLLAFRTRLYAHTPLVIRGPGAGPEVTAAGMLTDLMDLIRHPGIPAEPAPTTDLRPSVFA